MVMKIAIDTETTGLHWHLGHSAFAIGLYGQLESGIDDWHCYIDAPVNKKRVVDWNNPNEPVNAKSFEEIKEYITKADEVYFHNAKFDLHMLRKLGIRPKGKIHDTMLMSRIYNNREKNFKLKPLAHKYLNIPNDDELDLQKAVKDARKITGMEMFDYHELYWLPKLLDPTNKLCEIYCIKDVERTYKLAKFYLDKFTTPAAKKIYAMEIELLPILLDMEATGIKFYKDKAEERLFELHSQLVRINIRLKATYGKINFNSSQQVVKLLLKLGVPLTERTSASKTFPNGQLKASSKVLSDFADDFGVCKLLAHRGKVNRSIKELMNYLHVCNEDEMHPCINQCNAVTWRFSMSDPNLQKTTTKTTEKDKFVIMRDLFGPRDGYVWLAADYEQIELRIFADSSQEPHLLNAFRTGKDVHDETTDRIPFLIDMAEKEGRKRARNYGKSTNFTIVNGGGKNALWNNYRIPKEQGAKCIAGFKRAYPEAEKYMRNQITRAETYGYIETKTNRRLHTDPARPYTTAINYDIQPCAGDVMKLGLINCYNWIKENSTWEDMRILLSIHDELIFEIKKTKFDLDLVRIFKKLMEAPSEIFCIPIPVGCDLITTTWQNKEELSL